MTPGDIKETDYQYVLPEGVVAFNKRDGTGRTLELLFKNEGKVVSQERIKEVSKWSDRHVIKYMYWLALMFHTWSKKYRIEKIGRGINAEYTLKKTERKRKR